ncbi:hypothetical protein HWV62_2272 [Athelia sp. TMB]|nr:hypothetical protein HWV62_2272 [Athelia sp. TMB]
MVRNTATLGKATWEWNCEPALTAIIAGCVQLFYAWRILLLTKYRSITILVVLSTITAIIAGIDTAVLGQRHPLFSDWPGKFHIEFGTWLGASLLADLVIAATLLRFLWKRKTGDVAMDHVVNRIFMSAYFSCYFNIYV